MKGTEKIIAHIQADAASKAEEILLNAKNQCAEIRENYNNQAQEAYSARIRAGVKECESKADSAIRIAKMESGKSILALKQEMVAESFSRAEETIVNMPKDEYSAFLAKLAADAAAGNEEVVLNVADREKVGAEVVEKANKLLAASGKPAGLTLSDKTGSFNGGLILSRGNIEVNCTLEILMDVCRSDMAAEVAGALFA